MIRSENNFESTAGSEALVGANSSLFVQTMESGLARLSSQRPQEPNVIEITNPYQNPSDNTRPENIQAVNGELAQAHGTRSATVKQDGFAATYTDDGDGHTTEQYKNGSETVKTKDIQMHLLSGHGVSTVVENYNLPDGQFRQTATPGLPMAQFSKTQDEFVCNGQVVRVTSQDRYVLLMGNQQIPPTFEQYNAHTGKYESFQPTPEQKAQILAQEQKLQKEADDLNQKLYKIQNPLKQ